MLVTIGYLSYFVFRFVGKSRLELLNDKIVKNRDKIPLYCSAFYIVFFVLGTFIRVADEFIDYIEKNVPSDAKLGAVINFSPHLVNRKYLVMLPRHFNMSEYMILDLYSVVNKVISQEKMFHKIKGFILSAQYEVLKYKDGIILLKKLSIMKTLHSVRLTLMRCKTMY